LRQAMSLMWRTHPASMSFYTFSKADKQMDPMALAETGVVIGYRSEHAGALDLDGSKSDFESMSFGKVLSVDTVKRKLVVQVLREARCENTWIDKQTSLNAGQLSGIEDKTYRKPSSSLLPAPDSMADFEQPFKNVSTGNYILILRWCHQQNNVTFGTSLDAGFKVPQYIQHIAEETAVVLAADLVLHNEIGSFLQMDRKDKSQLDSQIYELFADKLILDGNLENELVFTGFTEGRMKGIISHEVWDGIQHQVLPFVERAWKELNNAARKRMERHVSYGESTALFSGIRRMGQKNAFRGLS
jgi:hypothetical protein